MNFDEKESAINLLSNFFSLVTFGQIFNIEEYENTQLIKTIKEQIKNVRGFFICFRDQLDKEVFYSVLIGPKGGTLEFCAAIDRSERILTKKFKAWRTVRLSIEEGAFASSLACWKAKKNGEDPLAFAEQECKKILGMLVEDPQLVTGLTNSLIDKMVEGGPITVSGGLPSLGKRR